ncbi:MAG: RelA/SpoT domain-containing protein [Thermoanaerobaculia bacterium]|nr:RelA/SpoT domain-containing protein [Thermoanaerobaculia bacterium]
MGVRSMLRTALRDETARPGQRFKRLERIIDKLVRYPKMRLSQMEDIGGCRAVLASLEDVSSAVEHIHRQWGDRAKATDYIASPKPDGYRGIHIIERRDGRLIEVQLRTRNQHAWAEAVERLDLAFGYGLKEGQGPADLREYFRLGADRLAAEDEGTALDSAAEARFDTLREQVRHYFADQSP